MVDFKTKYEKAKSENQHQKAEIKVRLHQELDRLFDQAYIVDPKGDVTYTMSIVADDSLDTYTEVAVDKVSKGAQYVKDAVIGKATPSATVSAPKKAKK